MDGDERDQLDLALGMIRQRAATWDDGDMPEVESWQGMTKGQFCRLMAKEIRAVALMVETVLD